MRRTQATAKVAAAALRLARRNYQSSFGLVQKGLFNMTPLRVCTGGRPVCFLASALHASPAGAQVVNHLPVYTLNTNYQVENSTYNWYYASGTSIGVHATSDSKYNQWQNSDQTLNEMYKWDYQAYTFTLDCNACPGITCSFKVQFYTPAVTRFERTADVNQQTLPGQLTSFGYTYRGSNAVNSEHWKKVGKPITLSYRPPQTGVHAYGDQLVVKTMFFKRFGNQKGIKIDDFGAINHSDNFTAKNEPFQIKLRDQIWCVITSDVPDVLKDSSGTVATAAQYPRLGCKCVAQWRDTHGSTN